MNAIAFLSISKSRIGLRVKRCGSMRSAMVRSKPGRVSKQTRRDTTNEC